INKEELIENTDVIFQPKEEREIRELPIERRFFNYLLELNQLREKVIRQYSAYERYWEFSELRQMATLIVEEEHTDAETILTIKRPKITNEDKKPPKAPKSIKQWLDFDLNNPNEMPKVKKWYKLINSDEYINFTDSVERAS